ncbi:hypothetical protein HW555_008810 [Spodoptera exigua]|uniref:Uncharacterized protein n=1 Tax=Spodoptera exigua TaxID=7107 RepID=A0A835L2F6_SPOEX|nr:hypothetical protein HW555_008810 [Spodoptera exigua]
MLYYFNSPTGRMAVSRRWTACVTQCAALTAAPLLVLVCRNGVGMRDGGGKDLNDTAYQSHPAHALHCLVCLRAAPLFFCNGFSKRDIVAAPSFARLVALYSTWAKMITDTLVGLEMLMLISAACAQLELGVLTQLYYPPPPEMLATIFVKSASKLCIK